MENADGIIEILKALGDTTRLNILKVLSSSGNNLCVTAISEKLEISQPVVSQHLKVLKNAGVVNSNKMGYHVHYSINVDLLANITALVKDLTTITSDNYVKPGCQKESS